MNHTSVSGVDLTTAWVAHSHAEVAFSLLIERLPNLALEGPEPEYRDIRTLRGLKSLNISFDARQHRTPSAIQPCVRTTD
jgi:hypothetical protein